jgi:peptide/nickel transport system substrate-binding protein
VSTPLEPTTPVQRKTKRLSRTSTVLLVVLVVVVIAAGVLGSLSLLTHFELFGAGSSGPTAPIAVRGGTWIDDSNGEPDSLIPNLGFDPSAALIDQALYLPLFYGDPQGMIHPGAATELPTVQNGGVSADATTWTFHLRPHLRWSDGQPYDARDVDFTWQLWRNSKINIQSSMVGLNMISKTDVSADHLLITFHLKRPFAPFLSYWVDGLMAPLPAHHFSTMAPEQILKSPDNLNPQITSGPFMMAESVPGDHYTLVRNPRYYRASEGLPYLDKVIFRLVADNDAILKDLQQGSLDSAWSLDVRKLPQYQHLTAYTLVSPLTSSEFEALWFNFHNTVLTSHQEVRQAMAMAVDQQALIKARYGLAQPSCTDHGSALHPGYDPFAPCPVFDLAAANKLLDDNG